MLINGRKIVIIGATSAIAEHCARRWSQEEPAEFILVGRNPNKIELIAADLRVRSPATQVSCREVDFYNPVAIQELADSVSLQGSVDIVLIAHGSLPDQPGCQADLKQCSEAIAINALSPALFAEAFVGHMEKTGKGTLAIIGSVAGDRGRKSNYIYGASKGLIDRYAQGLRHRMASLAVNVVIIKPGPTDTPMTAALKSEGAKLAPVESVAEDIIKGIQKGKSQIYTPTKWTLIMMIIRHLPQFIFNKLNI